jgi:chromosome segregation ATPase
MTTEMTNAAITFDSGTWFLTAGLITVSVSAIGILLGIIAKYIMYDPMQKNMTEQKEANEKLTNSITKLTTVMSEFKTFTAVQTEKNITDKEKFDVLFEKNDSREIMIENINREISKHQNAIHQHQLIIEKHTEEIRNNRHSVNNIKQNIIAINEEISNINENVNHLKKINEGK